MASMNRLIKNNSGYDLKQLFIGTEGTIGIVTRAVVRLVAAPVSQEVALLSARSYDDVLKILARSRRLPTLSAFEVMWADYYWLMHENRDGRDILPADQPFYILVEAMGYDDRYDRDVFKAFLAAVYEDGLIADAVVAESNRQCQQMWRVREGSDVLVRTMSPFLSFDVSLDLTTLEVYLSEVDRELRSAFPVVRMVTFGHLGDNNIHIGIHVGPDTMLLEEQIDKIVYGAIQRYKGAVSAEHGIGRIKRPYLAMARSSFEISMMRRLRTTFDPAGILNQEVLC
jgi:FAD/FMN-containing dehydrogenase